VTILKKLTDFERGYEQGKTDALKKMHPEIRALYEDYFDKCFQEYKEDRRQWVGLTDEEVAELAAYVYAGDPQYVRLIEAKLKEKNT